MNSQPWSPVASGFGRRWWNPCHEQTLLGSILLFVPSICRLARLRKSHPAHEHREGQELLAQTDPLKSAFDLPRQASEVGHYREALHQMNAHLSKGTSKQATPLTAEEKDALGKLYRLNNGEMAELDASLFRPLDAFHLENRARFRDAGRMLEIANIPPLEQGRICFAWVIRRVQLHEQGDVGLPPAFVVRRGFGNALDRALVFLALLQQFQIDGCLLAPPDRSSAASCPIRGCPAGSGQKTDPGLVRPAPGPARPRPQSKRDRHLCRARALRYLLKLSSIPADAIAKLEIYQVGPLEALSAEADLQNMLKFQDKIILYQDALGVVAHLAKVAGHDATALGLDPLPRLVAGGVPCGYFLGRKMAVAILPTGTSVLRPGRLPGRPSSSNSRKCV